MNKLGKGVVVGVVIGVLAQSCGPSGGDKKGPDPDPQAGQGGVGQGGVGPSEAGRPSAGGQASDSGAAGMTAGGFTAPGGASGAAGAAEPGGGAGGGSDVDCPSGFAECDGDLSELCEQDLSEPGSCGGCDTACTNAHGGVVCEALACKPTCDAGYDDCNGDPNDGCETALIDNAENCGACGRDCTSVGELCDGDGCVPDGPLTSCPAPPAAGTLVQALIDDLEDGDNGLARIGHRTGFWYTYLDKLGSTIVPAPDPTGTSPLIPASTLCHGGTKCVRITGTTAPTDEAANKYPYAGVGFDFSHAQKPCAYNASAYQGIKFWARGNVPITIMLNTTATTTADGGGTCTGSGCNGGYSPAGADVVLTANWQEITIPFATAAGPLWSTASTIPLDKANLLSLLIQIPAGQSYNVALDDVTFY